MVWTVWEGQSLDVCVPLLGPRGRGSRSPSSPPYRRSQAPRLGGTRSPSPPTKAKEKHEFHGGRPRMNLPSIILAQGSVAPKSFSPFLPPATSRKLCEVRGKSFSTHRSPGSRLCASSTQRSRSGWESRVSRTAKASQASQPRKTWSTQSSSKFRSPQAPMR